MADEQAALLAQIKALSGAIDQRKSSGRGGYQHNTNKYAYSNRGGASSYGIGRGGGGGGSSAGTSRHRSLVLSGPGSIDKSGPPGAAASNTPATTMTTTTTTNDGVAGSGEEGWVKRKSTHNMSLVSTSAFKKTEPARLAALAATQSAKTAAAQAKKSSKSMKSKGKSSNSVRRGDKMGEVIVDGVVFEFDESGTKLVKKNPQPTAEEKEEGFTTLDAISTTSDGSTPLRTSIDGRKFIRTKTGNLISQDLLDKRREARKHSEKLKRLDEMGKEIGSRQKMRDQGRKIPKTNKVLRKRGLCSFYNKTGQCKRGLSCPYTHNPDRLAICPGILRPSGCNFASGMCPLSHDKKPERVPHCVHFLRLGSCRNGEDCVYTHPSPTINLSNESAICMDFSDLGWCERGSTCTERHTWDCPEFLREGSCSRKGCKLMHVIRVDNLKKREEEDDEHMLADDDLFVRDDGAAEEGQKRKRESSEEDGEDGEHSPTWRPKKTRDFVRQQDFISFTDGEEEEDEDDDDGDEDVEEDGDDHESVHSDSSQE